MFEGNLFEALGLEVPKELKVDVKKEEAKRKSKGARAVSKAITKKTEETYVRLPVRVVYGFDNLEVRADEFEKDVVVFKVEKLLPDVEKQNKEIDSAENISIANDEKLKKEKDDKSNEISDDAYLFDESIPKVTLEVLRAKLEEDYPAFSKERTTMEYDKKNNIVVPIITKGSLGGCLNV